MIRTGLSRTFLWLLLAPLPLPLSAAALTFTVHGEIDVDIGAPLRETDEVWCRVWLRTGPSTSDFELVTLKARPIDDSRYVCKPSVFFRWGRADSYKASGANIVYGAFVVDSTRRQAHANDPTGERQITALGPSLYPPPAPKAVVDFPVVTLHL